MGESGGRAKNGRRQLSREPNNETTASPRALGRPVAARSTRGALPAKTIAKPAPEPSEVAVLMQDPMTRARFMSDLARQTGPLEDHPGGGMHREWVMAQYADAGNLRLGRSPRPPKQSKADRPTPEEKAANKARARETATKKAAAKKGLPKDLRSGESQPATRLNGTDTMARTVMSQLDAGDYDAEYSDYLLNGLRNTRVEDVRASQREEAKRKGAPKPFTMSAKAWETDHGVEAQHGGADEGPNYRLIDPTLHGAKSLALDAISTQYYDDPVRDLELDGDQYDHMAEVDLNDPNVGYFSETYGWSSDDYLSDGDDDKDRDW